MNKLADIIIHICENYPHKSELSNARVTKLVYLADWKSAQKNGIQLTDIKWYFHNYGPYVDDVIETAKNDNRIEILSTSTMYGDTKTLINAKSGAQLGNELSSGDLLLLNEVISETKQLYWDSFIQYVYDTYPIKTTNRHEYLNLVTLAKQSKNNSPRRLD